MANVKYFIGDMEVRSFQYMRNEEFSARFPGVKGIRVDGYSKLIGYVTGDMRNPRPIERVITYKANPSLHACNAKCMGGKINGTCECRCGGKNHGIGHFIGRQITQVLKVAE